MAKTGVLHQAATGVNVGKWVSCPAEINCRNGGVHISRENMIQLKEEMKQTLGHFVPMDKISAEAATWFLQKEATTTTAQDAVAEKANVDLTQTRMQEDLVKTRLKTLNSLTGGRARNFDAAREQILNKYATVSESPNENEYTEKLAQEIGINAEPKKASDVRNYSVRKGSVAGEYVLVVSNTYNSIEDEDDYNQALETEDRSKTPDRKDFPSWEQVQSDWENDMDVDDYYYEDPDYYFTSTREFVLNEEQKEQYKAASLKSQLEPKIAIASSKDLPSWSLGDATYGYSGNNALYQVKQLRRTNDSYHASLTRKLKSAESAARTRAKLLNEKETLENEISQATETLKTIDTPVVQKALKEYAARKKNDLRMLEPKLKRADKAGANNKIVEARKELETFETENYTNLTAQEKALWKDATVTWLASRFPSKNGSHRNSEANRWVKTHPNSIAQVKALLEREN